MTEQRKELKVRVVSSTGEQINGTVMLDPSKPRSCTVHLESRPPGYSDLEEFYLREYDCALMIWGQGNSGPDSTWRLHEADALMIRREAFVQELNELTEKHGVAISATVLVSLDKGLFARHILNGQHVQRHFDRYEVFNDLLGTFWR